MLGRCLKLIPKARPVVSALDQLEHRQRIDAEIERLVAGTAGLFPRQHLKALHGLGHQALAGQALQKLLSYIVAEVDTAGPVLSFFSRA